MSSLTPFAWQGQPSQIANPLKKKSKAKAKTSAERAEHVLSTRHGGMYSKAVPFMKGAT